jgi:plastocyanin
MTRGRLRIVVGALVVLGALIFTAPSSWANGEPHVVRMIGDASGYRFEPATITIASGESVVFEVASGAPHSVAFDTAAVSPHVARVLSTQMQHTTGLLSGPLLLQSKERYVVSFAGVPAGTYPFVCLPHFALQMKGTVIVR